MLVESKSDPCALYVYAMKSPATKEKYLLRLGKFLDFVGLQGSLEDKARNFAERGTKDSFRTFNNILGFMPSLKERLGRKEITAGTIHNYLKSIKLFCQSISWDKITRGLQRVYGNAEDRAPTNSKIRSSPGLLN